MINSFADKLKQLRTEKGLSQQQLAKMIYVDRSSIARWENGWRVPDVVVISRIAECLGVSPSELLPDKETAAHTVSIIIVDDEKPILNGELRTMSEVMPDAEITGFTKPLEALQYARENHIDIAFLDIELGKSNGFELCGKLLDINPKTNVVFLTAWPDYSLKAWSTKACGFLLKPLSREDVALQLQKLKHPIASLSDKK